MNVKEPKAMNERKVKAMNENVKVMLGNCRILQMGEGVVCDTPVPFYDMGISCGLPMDAELRRMAVDCFSKPFKTWTDERAPVHRQYYQGYYEAGAAMVRQLP